MGPIIIGVAAAAAYLGLYEILTNGLVHEPTKHWTEYLSSLGTLSVGILAAFIADRSTKIADRAALIAERQARTERNQFNLALFDKRVELYRTVRKLLFEVTGTGNPSLATSAALLDAAYQARWLLDEEMYEYMKNELHKKVEDLRDERRQSSMQQTDATQEKLATKHLELMQWFGKQYDVIEERFFLFLKIEQ